MQKFTFLLIYIIPFCYFSSQLDAQVNKFYDFRIGIGRSLVGRGDVRNIVYENELNYHFHKKFSISFSYDYSQGIPSHHTMVFHANQFNFNIFLSPFKKINSKGDFRIGAGISILNASGVYLERELFEDGILIERYYTDPVYRFNYGSNYLLEYSYLLTTRFLVGVKVFLFNYPYGDGTDIISGGILKIGYKL